MYYTSSCVFINVQNFCTCISNKFICIFVQAWSDISECYLEALTLLSLVCNLSCVCVIWNVLSSRSIGLTWATLCSRRSKRTWRRRLQSSSSRALNASSSIVYCLSRNKSDEMTATLRTEGILAILSSKFQFSEIFIRIDRGSY